MNISKENMLQLYVQGTLPSEAKGDFDRLVKEDPAFCESLVLLLSQDLGPAPEATLDSMSARLDARYDQIWKPAAQKPAAPVPAAAPKAPLLPSIRLPRLPTETYIFIGGVTLFALVALVTLTNPFQGTRTTSELDAIGQYRWIEPAPAAEAARPAPVRRAEAAKKAPKPAVAVSKPAPAAPALSERALKAQALVEQAMRSAPDGGAWVATTAPRSVPSASGDALPDLPDFEEAPSYTSTTAKGDMLRLSIPLAQAQAVKVRVTDPQGKPVRDLYSGYWEAGSHTIDWDVKDNAGKTLKAGEYNVLVEAGGQPQTQKVTIK